MNAINHPVKLVIDPLILKEKKKENARKKAAERSAVALLNRTYACNTCDKTLSSATALKTHNLSSRHLAKALEKGLKIDEPK
jgi:transcription elongation factor Elf1